MNKLIFILCCFTSLSLFGQAPLVEWAAQLGGNQRDFGTGISADHFGNVYVMGEYRETVDFDSGPGVFNLTAVYKDIFVSKYDMNGQFVWAISLNANNEFGNSITTDTIGNVYITGSFSDTLDFDPGPDVYQLIGNGDIFVLKLDTDGSFIWVKSFGGGYSETGRGIVVDDGGNVYTTGNFRSTVDFDPGPDVYNLSSNGDDDIYISKLNNNGDFVWAKSIGWDEPEISYSIALDSADNVYTTGYIESSVVDFDPGPDQFYITRLGEYDLFVSKLDTDGNFIWAKNMGGYGHIEGYDIVIDQAGSVYTTGYFEGNVDFDPGPDEFNLSTFDFTDIFISKLDNDGDFVWAKDIGGSYEESLYGYGIALDQSGNIYTTGSFEGNVDFDPGQGTYHLNSSYDDDYGDPNSDFFVLKLNSEGTFIWAVDFAGDDYYAGGSSIALDPWYNVYTTGNFYRSIDIDQECDAYTFTPHGYNDAFIHKMKQYQSCNASPMINGIDTSFAICFGDNIELSAEMPCWVGNISYSWSTGETAESIVVTPDSVTTYTLEVSYPVDTIVCTSSTSIEINFYQTTPEIPYNGLDDDCDETTLDDDLDQDGYILSQDCDDTNPNINIPAPPGTTCDDGNANTYGDIIIPDSCTCAGNPEIDGPEFEWVKQLEGDGGQSNSITTDILGNVYVTGRFEGTTDFDPESTIYNLTSSGHFDIFIAKYNANGQLEWAYSFGDPNINNGYPLDQGNGITTDASGNVYITGRSIGTVDFDPGPNTFYLSGYGPFILKLDPNGSFIWAKKMVGNFYPSIGNAIIVDDDQNVYTTGSFGNTTDFDPGPGVYNLTANYADEGYQDIFISKLNSDGEFVWAKSNGGAGFDISYSIALDSANNVFITGEYGWFDDTGSGSDNEGTLFVLKRSNDGDFIWRKNIGHSSTFSQGKDIAIDLAGSVYITGLFNKTIDFDPGPDDYHLESSGKIDIFILKLNNDGEFIWARSFGGGKDDEGNAIALDNNSNLYTTGLFEGIVDFDPGSETYFLPSYNERDVFILKLDVNGDFVWVGSFVGNEQNDYSNSIVLDDWDNIFTTGTFYNTLDFDPDLGVHELTANVGRDAFVHKMRQQPCNISPFISGTSSDFVICPGDSSILLTAEIETWVDQEDITFSWNSGETTSSIEVSPDSTSFYTLNVFYPAGPVFCNSSDSVEVIVVGSVPISITEDIELCEEEEALLEVEGGVSYLWNNGNNGNQITITAEEDQTYTVTVTDNYGCTGIDSVSISVIPLSDITYSESITCDSLLAGTYEFVLQDQNGCDSIVNVDNSYLPIPEAPVAPNNILIQENEPPFQISVPEVLNATAYLWEVPPGVQILSGENTNSIIVDWNGLATSDTICISAFNECGISPNACVEVNVGIIDGLNDIDRKGYYIFPNPTSGLLQIVFSEPVQGAYEIRDLTGKLMLQNQLQKESSIDLQNQAQGVYILLIKTEKGTWIERIVKL